MRCLTPNTTVPTVILVSRQCPGTTIERNFEVGTSLSVSLVVNGSAALDALCDESSSESSSESVTTSISSVSSCRQVSNSASSSDGAPADAIANNRRRLRGSGDNIRSPYSLSGRGGRGFGHRLLQGDDQLNNATLGQAAGDDGGWGWDSDGPIFGLGELSRIRLSSHVLLLNGDEGPAGAWAPLRNTSSASAVEEAEAAAVGELEKEGRVGVITASFESVEATAVFSTLLFFNSVELAEGNAGSGGEGETELPGHTHDGV